MNYCRETTKMGVPARHRERSGEAGGPPANRRVLVSVPVAPRNVSFSMLTPEAGGSRHEAADTGH
jgi:hypothetical protein